MNQSSEIRKMSGVWQRQQNEAVLDRSGLDQPAALGQVGGDLLGRVAGREPCSHPNSA